MRRNKYLAILIVTVIVMSSCRKIEQLPAVPHIEFTSFTVFDTTDILGNINKAGKLKFYFEDGDGDLGLKPPSEFQNDTTNLFITLFRKAGGTMNPVSDKSDPLLPYSSYRIPYMERLGQNQILKGTVSITFLYTTFSPDDTIKYDFFIMDRALHESNISSTAEIIVSANNIYQK